MGAAVSMEDVADELLSVYKMMIRSSETKNNNIVGIFTHRVQTYMKILKDVPPDAGEIIRKKCELSGGAAVSLNLNSISVMDNPISILKVITLGTAHKGIYSEVLFAISNDTINNEYEVEEVFTNCIMIGNREHDIKVKSSYSFKPNLKRWHRFQESIKNEFDLYNEARNNLKKSLAEGRAKYSFLIH